MSSICLLESIIRTHFKSNILYYFNSLYINVSSFPIICTKVLIVAKIKSMIHVDNLYNLCLLISFAFLLDVVNSCT